MHPRARDHCSPPQISTRPALQCAQSPPPPFLHSFNSSDLRLASRVSSAQSASQPPPPPPPLVGLVRGGTAAHMTRREHVRLHGAIDAFEIRTSRAITCVAYPNAPRGPLGIAEQRPGPAVKVLGGDLGKGAPRPSVFLSLPQSEGHRRPPEQQSPPECSARLLPPGAEANSHSPRMQGSGNYQQGAGEQHQGERTIRAP